ncbi:hypothetical protein ACSQ67_020780 [Phaseolus vulgaris]
MNIRKLKIRSRDAESITIQMNFRSISTKRSDSVTESDNARAREWRDSRNYRSEKRRRSEIRTDRSRRDSNRSRENESGATAVRHDKGGLSRDHTFVCLHCEQSGVADRACVWVELATAE